MFRNFQGNTAVAQTLFAMTQQERIPQTLLFDGAEGVGKATLVRRFAPALPGGAGEIGTDALFFGKENNNLPPPGNRDPPHPPPNPPPLSSHPLFLLFSPP